MFVKCPITRIWRCGNCQIVNERNPHVWVSFQTKYHNGGTDEEHRNYSYSLKMLTLIITIILLFIILLFYPKSFYASEICPLDSITIDNLNYSR